MPRGQPVVFWLLLAATLCVDVVAVYWILDSLLDFGEPSGTLFLALAFGQLSALCARAIFARERVGWRWLAPFICGLTASLIAAAAENRERSIDSEELVAFIGLFWLHVIIALAILWALKSHRRAWRFSIANLLVLMTVSAIVISIVGRNELLHDEFWSVITLVLGNIVLLAASIVIRYYQDPMMVRVALDCAAAMLIGTLWHVFEFAFADSITLVALYLIQALTLGVWLEFIRVPNLADSNAP
jgi:hypothetical protein